jgi:hypothetical protein
VSLADAAATIAVSSAVLRVGQVERQLWAVVSWVEAFGAVTFAQSVFLHILVIRKR